MHLLGQYLGPVKEKITVNVINEISEGHNVIDDIKHIFLEKNMYFESQSYREDETKRQRNVLFMGSPTAYLAAMGRTGPGQQPGISYQSPR